jgi:hypothetical protein
MRQLVAITIVLACGSGLAAGCGNQTPVPVQTGPLEPTHEGKTATQWIAALSTATTRAAALRALGTMRTPDPLAAPAIANCLGDTDASIRELAVATLRKYGIAGVGAAAALLRTGTQHERDGAVEVLAQSGETGIPGLILALDVPRESTRAAAVKGLQAVGDAAREPLRKAMKEGSPVGRLAALEALTALQDDEALVAALDQEALTQHARDALAQRGEAARATVEGAVKRLGELVPAARVLDDLNAARAERTVARIPELGEAGIAPAVALGKPSVAPLVKLLDHDDAKVRAHAVSGLFKLEKLAEEALSAVLETGTVRAQTGAAEVLATTQSKSARRRVVMAMGSKSAETRAIVVAAVEQAGDSGRITMLEALNHGEIPARKEAVHGVARMGEFGARILLKKMAEGPPALRALCLNAFAALGPSGTVHVIEALTNDDPRIVKRASQALQKAGADVVPAVLARAGDPDWPGRTSAVEVVLSIGPSAVPLVLEAAISGPPPVRALARRMMARMGGAAMDLLISRVHSKDDATRAAAADALVGFVPDNQRAVRALIAHLDDSSAEVRYAAVRGVGALGDAAKSHRKALNARLRESDARVRTAAAAVLLRLDPKNASARKALDQAWDDADVSVRRAALHLSFSLASEGARSNVILRALNASQPQEIRSAALDILDQLPLEPWMARSLRSASEDADEGLRLRAAKRLKLLSLDPWLEESSSNRRSVAVEKLRKSRRAGSAGKRLAAVDVALDWLASSQSSNGSWSGKYDGCDPGVTGLALLAFLANGETPGHGPHAATVKRGLQYLISVQDSEGCLGPRTAQWYQYNHTLGAQALIEAYGMTGVHALRDPAQRAVNFIHQSQNPYLAWRYGVRDGDNDTSVTGFMVAALRAAKRAELEVDSTAFKGAIAWVEKMTEPEHGRVGYQRRGGQS